MAAAKKAVKKAVKKAASATKTVGAIRAGNGQYHFRMAKLNNRCPRALSSTSHGGVVEGSRILVGYIHKPRGTGSRMHTHKNEQLNYVLQGTLVGSVNGKRVVAPAGTLIYIPANAPHNLIFSWRSRICRRASSARLLTAR
jgi:quercetin dioxygenase-like cupin family protein